MSSERDAVKRVLDAFEHSVWSEIDVKFGTLRVHLSTNAGNAPATTSKPPPTTAVIPIAVPAGAHVVTSPSPGILWRAPEPGAPPFVDVGERVDASSTVCIVELMKLMSHVKAAVAGEVVAVFVENGIAVQKGDALIAVIPDADGVGT